MAEKKWSETTRIINPTDDTELCILDGNPLMNKRIKKVDFLKDSLNLTLKNETRMINTGDFFPPATSMFPFLKTPGSYGVVFTDPPIVELDETNFNLKVDYVSQDGSGEDGNQDILQTLTTGDGLSYTRKLYHVSQQADMSATDFRSTSKTNESITLYNENGTITNESIVYCLGAVTLTLPPTTIKNRRIIVKSKNEHTDEGIISIVPSLESEYIDYVPSIELEPLGYIELISDGEHWNVISKSNTSSGSSGVNFGDRVIVLTGNGDNAQKTTELLTAYSTAKTMSPTSSSPVTILLPPGNWCMYSTFVLDTEYINISSITGRNDVSSNCSDWQITADNISINGISWKGGRLRIHGNYPNVLIENCGGYIAGPSTGDPVNISSTFRNINSIGYQTFFNDGIIELSGVFENIKCGSGFSLGNIGAGSKLSGKFINCTTAGSGVFMADELSGLFVNCSGDYNSFIGNITGKMYDCIATQGFSTISSGVVRRCTLEGSGFTFPTPSAGGKVQLCIDSATV